MKILVTVVKCGKFGEMELVSIDKSGENTYLLKFTPYEFDTTRIPNVTLTEDEYITLLDKYQSNIIDFRETNIPSL